MDLSATQLQILCGVLTPLSLCLPPDGVPAAPSSAAPGTQHAQQHLQQQQTMLSVHELSMFLLAQLYSREAQRPDNVEVWPDTAPSLSPLSMSDSMCSSPTRAAAARSPSGNRCRGAGHATLNPGTRKAWSNGCACKAMLHLQTNSSSKLSLRMLEVLCGSLPKHRYAAMSAHVISC